MSGQDNLSLTKEYAEFLENLKAQVASSRYRAVRAVNTEMIKLYHHIGTEILRKQSEQGWGSKVIDKLSKDLLIAFPDMKGFSVRNLKYMRKFAEEYHDTQFVQEVLAQLTWYHNITLLDKISDKRTRMFYVEHAIAHGWSRNVMVLQIETQLHHRQGKAITNFEANLPPLQSDLAHYTLKDPYIFDFLSIGQEAHEREVEKALIAHMEKFILELGSGFAFVGRQYHLEVGNQDFYIDLLFYHLKLRCFVIIELKDKDFKPEYAGKMNFYLSAVDDLLKHESDQPSIGLILCKSKKNVLAEYALRNMSAPIGLAEYRLTESLPENIKTELPTIEELEAELSKRVTAEEETKEISLGSNQFTAESENSPAPKDISFNAGKGDGQEAVTLGTGNSSARGLPVTQVEQTPSHINPRGGNNRGKGGVKPIPVSVTNPAPSGNDETAEVPVAISNSNAGGNTPEPSPATKGGGGKSSTSNPSAAARAASTGNTPQPESGEQTATPRAAIGDSAQQPSVTNSTRSRSKDQATSSNEVVQPKTDSSNSRAWQEAGNHSKEKQGRVDSNKDSNNQDAFTPKKPTEVNLSNLQKAERKNK